MKGLVLSLFPGIGLLDMAFEEEGFCVVRGPDLLWGGDIRRFHPPAGRFDGVTGGPPCQAFSRFRFLNPSAGVHGNLIPEFERVVSEAGPEWFLMENVPDAPMPAVEGYTVKAEMLSDAWVGGATSRTRRFSFGAAGGVGAFTIEQLALHAAEPAQAVTGAGRLVPVALVRDGNGGHRLKKSLVVHGGHGEPFDRPPMSIAEAAELQGLPPDFLAEAPFTAHAKRKAIGNGVPLPMGRAVAKAVARAIAERQSHDFPHDSGGAPRGHEMTKAHFPQGPVMVGDGRYGAETVGTAPEGPVASHDFLHDGKRGGVMGKGLIDAGMCEHGIRSLLGAGVRRNDDTRAGARLRAWLAEYERITGHEYPTPTKEG